MEFKFKPFTDETEIPFGKYQGTRLRQVPASYLMHYYRKTEVPGFPKESQLIEYIEANMPALIAKEVAEKNKYLQERIKNKI